MEIKKIMYNSKEEAINEDKSFKVKLFVNGLISTLISILDHTGFKHHLTFIGTKFKKIQRIKKL